MNSLSHLTPDELAMLLEGDMAHSDAALLAGELQESLLNLLQRSDRMTLEAEVDNHRLRFPLTLHPTAEGAIEPHLAPPAIEELHGNHPRPWRLHEKIDLWAGPFRWQVLDLSEQGMLVDTGGFDPNPQHPLSALLCLTESRPLPLLGRWVRLARPPCGWALQFHMHESDQTALQQWLFERHQQNLRDKAPH